MDGQSSLYPFLTKKAYRLKVLYAELKDYDILLHCSKFEICIQVISLVFYSVQSIH